MYHHDMKNWYIVQHGSGKRYRVKVTADYNHEMSFILGVKNFVKKLTTCRDGSVKCTETRQG